MFSRAAVLCAAAFLTSCGDDEQQPAAQPGQSADRGTPAADTSAAVEATPTKGAEPQQADAAVAESSTPADQGMSQEQRAVALYQEAAEELKQDTDEARKKAFAVLTQAAELGYAEAQYSLGGCYREGVGTEVDMAKAAACFEKAAEQNHRRAQREIAFLYHQGIGVERDLGKAERYYRAAAEAAEPDVESMVLLGLVLAEDEQRMEEAVACFRKASELGNPYAQAVLGVLTLQGRGGIPADPTAAYKLFSSAAQQGISDALCNQGYCLQKGIGTARDEAQAVVCYSKAVEKTGHSQAKYNLSLCYLYGIGTAKDVEKALPLLVEASNAGVADATCELARCCALGIGMAQDEDKAFAICLQAAQKGSAEAQYTLARYFREGGVVEKNEAYARRCLETAAANGHPQAGKELEGNK